MAYGFNDNKSKVEVLPKSFWTPKRPTYVANIGNGYATLTMIQVGYIVIGTLKINASQIGGSATVEMDGTKMPKPSSLVTSALQFGDDKYTALILPITAGYYNHRLLIASSASSNDGVVTFIYPVDA